MTQERCDRNDASFQGPLRCQCENFPPVSFDLSWHADFSRLILRYYWDWERYLSCPTAARLSLYPARPDHLVSLVESAASSARASATPIRVERFPALRLQSYGRRHGYVARHGSRIGDSQESHLLYARLRRPTCRLLYIHKFR